jgi:hypothetical protein
VTCPNDSQRPRAASVPRVRIEGVRGSNPLSSTQTAGQRPVDLSGALLRRSFVGGSLAGQIITWRQEPQPSQPCRHGRRMLPCRIPRRWGETNRVRDRQTPPQRHSYAGSPDQAHAEAWVGSARLSTGCHSSLPARAVGRSGWCRVRAGSGWPGCRRGRRAGRSCLAGRCRAVRWWCRIRCRCR